MSITSNAIQDGTLNFFFGGALGALVEASMPALSDIQACEEYQIAFYSAIFGTAGKMVSADGVIADFELDTVRQFISETLMLDASWERFALSLFSQAIESSTPVEAYLEQFAEIIEENSEVAESFLNFLTALAISDGEFAEPERKILLSAERILDLPKGSVAQILSQYGWTLETCSRMSETDSALTRSYALLELPINSSVDEIEKAFRVKTKEFSPQLVSHQGYPAEFVKFANQRFHEICGAYKTIMSELN